MSDGPDTSAWDDSTSAALAATSFAGRRLAAKGLVWARLCTWKRKPALIALTSAGFVWVESDTRTASSEYGYLTTVSVERRGSQLALGLRGFSYDIDFADADAAQEVADLIRRAAQRVAEVQPPPAAGSRPPAHEPVQTQFGRVVVGYAVVNAVISLLTGVLLIGHTRGYVGNHPFVGVGILLVFGGLGSSMMIAAIGLLLTGVGTLITQGRQPPD